MSNVIETTDIGRCANFRIKYTYHEGSPAIGSPAVVQAEPATVEIHGVTIEGATVMYHSPLWDSLASRILEDYV